MKFILLSALTALAIAAPSKREAAESTAAVDIAERYAAVRSTILTLKGALDNDAYLDIGPDSVARTVLHGAGTVLDAIRLSPHQLEAMAIHLGNKGMLKAVQDGAATSQRVDESDLYTLPNYPLTDEVTDDELAAAMKNPNPTAEAKKDLEGRSLYCIGRRCTRAFACFQHGCQSCLWVHYDSVWKVCLP